MQPDLEAWEVLGYQGLTWVNVFLVVTIVNDVVTHLRGVLSYRHVAEISVC